ncbi:hypothetical protein DQ04_08781000 [Trypanosoma grayi]|uniref:hypothetical protein n=1 Tax=Trypanosoma grayi TaxID=71804 RepID=UPI0004F4BD4A|nr:hypothetical protein DQ04_08781000 [Trypanosoma grayi]KEG07802.1 hypothetical protein DQ04_08781000 [Trypanosoma grayi]
MPHSSAGRLRRGSSSGRRGLVRSDDDEDDNYSNQYSWSPSPVLQWTEWGQQFSAGRNAHKRNNGSPEHGLMDAVRGKEKQTTAESEVQRTREVLLRYKRYVEERLMRYIQELEDRCAHRGKLCERLKRDNALLLEELDRCRAAPAPAPPLRKVAKSPNYTSPLKLPQTSLPHTVGVSQRVREDATPSGLDMLRAREEGLLRQLHEERVAREKLQAAYAEIQEKMQKQIAHDEDERRIRVDAQSIRDLRDALARRDEEIRHLRRLHGFSIAEPLEGVPWDGEEGAVAEFRAAVGDAGEFVAAMDAATAAFVDAAAVKVENDTPFKRVAQLWEEVGRLAASLPCDASASLQQPQLQLLIFARALRCAVEQEHNEMALFVRKLLGERDELRESIAREQRDRAVERQAAAHRLHEVGEEGAALAQQLQQRLDSTTQRATSWMGLDVPTLRQQRECGAPPAEVERCDAATQTLLSVELSGFILSGPATRLNSRDSSNEPLSSDLCQLLRDMEALESDNAAKAALIAQLQQQRERFLGSVDAEFAVSVPARATLTGAFCQYLLE